MPTSAEPLLLALLVVLCGFGAGRGESALTTTKLSSSIRDAAALLLAAVQLPRVAPSHRFHQSVSQSAARSVTPQDGNLIQTAPKQVTCTVLLATTVHLDFLLVDVDENLSS